MYKQLLLIIAIGLLAGCGDKSTIKQDSHFINDKLRATFKVGEDYKALETVLKKEGFDNKWVNNCSQAIETKLGFCQQGWRKIIRYPLPSTSKTLGKGQALVTLKLGSDYKLKVFLTQLSYAEKKGKMVSPTL